LETKKTVKLAASRIGRNNPPPDANPYNPAYSEAAARVHGDGNLERTLATYRMAGEAGADVIVSTENVRAWGSYTSFEQHGLLMKLLDRIPGPLTDAVGDISKKYGMYTATNFDCLENDGKVYNTTVFIGRDGKIIGKYRKTHLPASENWIITPGTEYPVFETDIGRIGFSICHDIAFPEQMRCMAVNGADIILHATGGWGFVLNHSAYGLALLQVRAAENSVFLVNSYAMNKNVPGSSSCIISNRGDLLAENLSQDVDGIVMAEIVPDYELLHDNNMWNFFSDVRSERMRLMLERAPETYGALMNPNPPLAAKYYPQYKYAKTREEIAPISAIFNQARQDGFNGKGSELFRKEW